MSSIMYDFDNSNNIPAFGEDIRDAIDNGDIVRLRRTLDNGADINMHFGKYKATPIHFASKKQNLEIVEELFKRGANINGTDGINDRPLHESVRFGSQHILTFLLENGADPNVQNSYEDTPLLYCFDTTRFRAKGWTKKAMTLMRHGARKDIKNMHSKMALDHLQSFLNAIRNGKNIEKEIRNSEDLAEAYHLYDVLSEEQGQGKKLLQYVIQSLKHKQDHPPMCHGRNMKEMCETALSILEERDWNQAWENLQDIPSEIRQLGTVTEDEFLRSLKIKHTKAKCIRLMIVGDVGVGKTSLCLNLINEEKPAVPTDGINVFIQNYTVDMKTGKWRRLSDSDINKLPTMVLSTVCRAEVTTESDKTETITNKKDEDRKDNDRADTTKRIKGKKGSARRKQKKKKGESDDGSSVIYSRVTPEDQTQASDSSSPSYKRKRNDSEKMKSTLRDVNCVDVLKDDEALLSIWDFAGDDVYEATHHIFMSSDAVYIIVFNADDFLQDKANLEKLYTWQDLIKTYSTEQSETTTSKLTPPIILVGSHLDKLGNSEKEKKESKDKLFDSMEGISSDTNVYLVDNTNKDDPGFQQIRDHIVEVAKHQKNWGKMIPATWLNLDIDLRSLKQQKRYIVKLSEVIDIDSRNEVSIGDADEIKTFLRYMHLTGNILFFENKTEEDAYHSEPYIVTHPQLVVEAFRCIIKAMRFVDQYHQRPFYAHMRQFHKTGILTLTLLQNLWERRYREYEHFLLGIMQRLHLIVAVKDERKERLWIVPSILPSTEDTLFQPILDDTEAVISKTLCFVFTRKPIPAIFDKLLAVCISQGNDLQVKKDEATGKPLIQRGSACLMINPECSLLLSCRGAVVSCTLVNHNKQKISRGKYEFARKHIIEMLLQIFTQFHHKNIEYKLCLHCRHSICNDRCPVPIDAFAEEERIRCCKRQHSLHRSDAKLWMEPENKSDNKSSTGKWFNQHYSIRQ
ncbi:uncharacterized protein [Argopecten irradians]|uniref:uncharacterized protein isoform X2 n=1 Tax=Argopecten irradians TaxID=31199 RepID=UPI0037161AB7